VTSRKSHFYSTSNRQPEDKHALLHAHGIGLTRRHGKEKELGLFFPELATSAH